MPARERLTSLAQQEARTHRSQAPSRAHASQEASPEQLWRRFDHGPRTDLGAHRLPVPARAREHERAAFA